MILDCYAICAPGLIRQENQDNFYINGIFRKDIAEQTVFIHSDKTSGCGLYAVADGMGGEEFGELASLIAVQAMDTLSCSDKEQNMVQYLIERNTVICDLINEKNGTRIGSTFAGLHIRGESAAITNIGDSRVYLLRSGELMQMSRDHNVVEQMISLGIISKEAARSHHARHKLTQHLGIFPSEMVIEPYTADISIEENDLFLLCSDGLTDMLDDYAIEKILKSLSDIKQKTEALYEATLQNGGKDNITILLVQVLKE